MCYRLLFIVSSAILCFAAVSAEDSETAARFTEYAKQIALEYKLEAGDRSLVLRQTPVLTWTDPENGEIYGAVFVWTDNEVPATIASIYKWYRPYTHSTHEFQSLSTKPITGLRAGQGEWRCLKPGVEWKPVPDNPVVGRTAAQRLTRLRLLARQFTLRMTEKDGSVETLRLLPQPLYRYQPASGDVVDGAIFAFVRGTDPEVILLLEAHREGDEVNTYYAFARSNFLPTSASLGGQEVWNVERLDRATMKAGTEPYTKFIFKD